MKKKFLIGILIVVFGLAVNMKTNAEQDPTGYLTESTIVYINNEYCIKVVCTSIPSWMCDRPGSVWYIPTGGLLPW